MEKLLAYINALNPEEREAFEVELRRLLPDARTSINYLRKAVSKKQVLGAKICSAIEMASGSRVTRQDLRSDDWGQVWPELKDAA